MAILALVGGLLPTAIATFYFWHAGVLPTYLDANWRANVAYLDSPLTLAMILARLRFGLLPLIGLLPWPIVLLALVRDAKTRPRYATSEVAIALVDCCQPRCRGTTETMEALLQCAAAPALLDCRSDCAVVGRSHLAASAMLLVSVIVVVLAPTVGLMVKHIPNSWEIDRTNVPLVIADLIDPTGTTGLTFTYSIMIPWSTPMRTRSHRPALCSGSKCPSSARARGLGPQGEITRILGSTPHWIVVAEPSPYGFTPKVWHELDLALRSYRLAAVYSETDYIQPPIAVRVYENH